ncbi:MAG: hypothetical protein KKH80_03440 [Candidatus Omnitrophica bacterium]|nr:hypothetical protein [Candidatus Omnitrophota bacterium]
MKNAKVLATGIGSLPHKDVDTALDLIFQYTPYIPFWPQLPKRDKKESMVIQYSQNLPCLRLGRDGLSFDSSRQEQELAEFYERIIADDVEHFKVSEDFAAGLWGLYHRLGKESLDRYEFIKGQICGPFTFAASINNEQQKAILYDDVLMQAVQEGLAMKARWQVNLFKKFAKQVIIFLDEPYLTCFGSAFTAINREEVIGRLSEISKKIKSSGALIGVHCCGNTDWSMFSEIAGIDIISFDAFNFLDKFLLYTKEINSFLKRGGMLAWGIVPTEDFGPQIDARFLFDKLKQAFNILEDKGIGQDLIKRQLILTPSCGLGTLDTDKAKSIFECLSKVFSIFV